MIRPILASATSALLLMILVFTNSTESSAQTNLACGSGTLILNSDGALFRPYQERTMTMSSGEDRKFLLRLPSGYQPGTPSDVVFNFHGATSNAQQQFAYADFTELADRDNVILVSPDGNKTFPDRDHELAGYWDSAWEGTKRVRDHDIKFVLELVDQLQSEYCTGDFYSTGMSAGGDMSTALQCATDGPFDAYAPVTYRYYDAEDCSDAAPKPMISFHGSEDRVVPLTGLDAPWFDPHVAVIMQSWAEQNGCDSEAIEHPVSEHVIRYEWENCDARTEWYLIEGGGHTWPGSQGAAMLGRSTDEISATNLIWDFFFEGPGAGH